MLMVQDGVLEAELQDGPARTMYAYVLSNVLISPRAAVQVELNFVIVPTVQRDRVFMVDCPGDDVLQVAGIWAARGVFLESSLHLFVPGGFPQVREMSENVAATFLSGAVLFVHQKVGSLPSH